jgi:hypothetical protein
MYGDSKVINEIKYFVIATDDQNSIESEGYWTFKNPVKLFEDMSETNVVNALEADTIQGDVCVIKSGLESQLVSLKSSNIAKKPWEKPTFKLTI